MPTNRRRRRRIAAQPVHWVIRELLMDGDPKWERDDYEAAHAWLEAHWLQRDGLRKAWDEIGEELVAAWAVEHPGTRPSYWWRWSCPQRPGPHLGFAPDETLPATRLRIGGTGELLSDHLAYGPEFYCGLPVRWLTEKELAKWPSLCGKAIPFDLNDPPIFESQAAYLKRHALLLPDELERLTDVDFEPVAIELPSDS